jgi:GT2 family glycosyltransferase
MATAAVIIPTLLGGPMLEDCLRALDRQDWRDFEVVVINNRGTKLDLDCSAFTIPVRMITPGANVGFGAAINLGMQLTGCALVATLNDDTVPGQGWLRELVSGVQTHPRTGMCASSIRMYLTECLDSAGMLICFDGSSKQRGERLAPTAFADSREALLPSACAAIYRREMLDEIGGFDEDFFLYCEDTDLGLRARWAGWQCSYAPRATVGHHYSATAGAVSLLKARYVERNRLWVAIKNFPLPLLLAMPACSAFRYFLQWQAAKKNRSAAAQFLAGHSVSQAFQLVAKAHFETLQHLPRLIRKRIAIRRTRRMSPTEYTRLLRTHRISLKDLARA